MTYDDAEWHYDSVRELDLDVTAASTHIGMFMAWLALHDLTQSDCNPAELHTRAITPGDYLRRYCVNQIDPSMLTDAGNSFTTAGYEIYLKWYRNVPAVARHGERYGEPDTWETYDEVAGMIDELYAEWRSGARSANG